MCGRYYIDDDLDDAALVAYFLQAQERADRAGVALSRRGEIFPTNVVPVIATGALHRSIGAYPMRWGFPHPARNLLVINTRSETAAEKPLLQDSAAGRRCLIPASGYFEWKKGADGKKARYAFCREDGAPLYLAGLYRKDGAAQLPCFSILTKDADASIQSIHARMPVLLPKALMADWLSPERSFQDLIACIGAAEQPVSAGIAE